jgi:hypothetical protein
MIPHWKIASPLVKPPAATIEPIPGMDAPPPLLIKIATMSNRTIPPINARGKRFLLLMVKFPLVILEIVPHNFMSMRHNA